LSRVERDEGDDVLDLKAVDLASLAEALEDNSYDHEWWLDPKTGAVEPWSTDSGLWEDGDEQHPAERNWVQIEPIGSREAYLDMEDFIERVRDPRARELLERAIAGRGAFRRFKDTLFEFPELRQAWFTFHDVRMERRALEWLADEELVDRELAEQAMQDDPEPPGRSGRFDAEEIAGTVAADLRRLYGDRLRKVLLFGSWARGDAHPESDIDLLVVLDRLESPWEELRRMDDILWRHSLENDTIVCALPVDDAQFSRPDRPVVIRAKADGRALA
jgi:predicted nucleotidyltransferase